jgi:PIN domain nuclease of toxin-antitoxin system
LATLDWHHRDPFDRVLIAQAITEDMTLVTADQAFAAYPAKILPAA